MWCEHFINFSSFNKREEEKLSSSSLILMKIFSLLINCSHHRLQFYFVFAVQLLMFYNFMMKVGGKVDRLNLRGKFNFFLCEFSHNKNTKSSLSSKGFSFYFHCTKICPRGNKFGMKIFIIGHKKRNFFILLRTLFCVTTIRKMK